MLQYNILSNIFPATGNGTVRYRTAVFQVLFISFFDCWNHISFFYSVGNFPFSRHDRKINSSGLQTEASQIFIPRIFIVSCALSWSRFLISSRMSSLVKCIVDSNLNFQTIPSHMSTWQFFTFIEDQEVDLQVFSTSTLFYFYFLISISIA